MGWKPHVFQSRVHGLIFLVLLYYPDSRVIYRFYADHTLQLLLL